MSRKFTFLLCFPLLLAAFTSSAQQINNVELTGHVMRKPLVVPDGLSSIQLCGLKPGYTYTVIVNDASLDSKTRFELHPDAALQQASTAIGTLPERPNMVQFTAPSDCAGFDLTTFQKGQVASDVSIYLSVHCNDCPETDTWKENFISQMEMVNLSTTPGIGASSLVTNTLIGGNCFDVANITSAGAVNSRGTFANGGTNIGIATGAVLCTGHVNILPGPNNQNNANNGFNTNSADDADLATLSNGNQWDLSKIEFDFTPTATTVQFDFVFGSEEYCEFVGSAFNDVFGFFISGPGLTGNQNIALIPSTSTPVTINNVNHQTNTAYYVNNSTLACNGVPPTNTAECQLDGWTTVLTATANLQPCQTYHIKLAIADIGDQAYASAVFLKANSFDAGGQVKADVVYPSGQQFIYEDCGPGGFIRFRRGSGDINVPVVVNFTVGGTATPGLDYAPITSPITIPAGVSEILIPVTAFADLILEGDETITILLDNPCSCTQTEVVFTIRDKEPVELDMDDVVICGSGGAALSPTVTGGLAPYTYLWSTGSNASSINVTAPGVNTYTVTVTDICGTTATVSATTTITPAPTATLTGSGLFCAGVPNSFNLTLTMTGTGPWDVTYNSPGGQVTQTFNTSPATIVATQPGNYSLVSINTTGCVGTVTGNITLNEITVNLNLNAVSPPCYGINNGTITASSSGGSGPFIYNWNTGSSGGNQTGLAPGTYTVTVTNGNGCTAMASATLNESPLMTATISSSLNIDCNNPLGNADLTVDGGTPGYTYQWSNNSSLEDPNFPTAGTYSVTVTDSKGCTKTTSVTITSNTALPTAVILPPAQLNCNVTMLTLNASGSSQGSQFTYNWGGPSFVCCETTLQPQIDQGGTYTLTVTNTVNGCTKTASVTVAQNNTPPNVNINTPPNIGCNMPTISLNGNGSSTGPGITYLWTTSDGNIVSGSSTLNPQVNLAGTYTLLVSNGTTGCTSTESVTVSGNTQLPTATIAPPGVVDCTTPEISIDATGSSQGGNFTYNWTSTPPGGISGGGNTLTPDVDQAGTYTLTVTNTDNQCTATASVAVTSNLTPPVAAATPPALLTCAVTQITINGSGSSTGPNFSYEWTTNGGNIVSGETTLNPLVDGPGTYTLVVTNTTNGCTKSVTVTVPQNITPPNININNPPNIGCTTPTISLNGNGSATGPNISYLWTTSDGNIVSGATTLNPQVNLAGTYTLVVTNGTTGCTSEESVTVTGNTQLPTATIAPPGIVDCYTPEITIDASGSSQGGNFNYNWTSTPPGGINGGGNTLNPDVDQAGTYTLTVTDTDNNCTATASVTVTSNLTPPVAVAATPPQLTCQNPVLTLNGSGSSTGPNFTYEWTTNNGNILSGETTLNPMVDQPGAYTLVVTNTTNGCTKSVTVNVNANQNFPVAGIAQPQELNCFHPTIQLQGQASTGPNFTFAWSANPGNFVSGQNTLTPTVNQPGFYTLLVTNTSNGCTSDDVVEVTENFNTPVATIAPPAIITCDFPEIDIDASGSSQDPGLVYTWTSTPPGGIVSGGNTLTPTVDQPGTYKLTITDPASGCTATSQVVVTQNITPPTANAGPGGQLSCQTPTMTLNGTGSSGPNFFYEWTTLNGNIVSGETTLNPVVDEGGTYTLLVTNSTNGCTAQSSVNITVNQNFPNATVNPYMELNCQNAGLVELSGTGSSTGPTYTYLWTPNPGNIVSGGSTLKPKVNQAGTYTLVVTNTSNGCTDFAEVEVVDNIVYPVPVIAPPQELNCVFTSISIDAGNSVTSSFGAYQWSGPSGGFVSGQNTAFPEVDLPGAYYVTITNEDNFCTATASVVVTQNITIPTAVAVSNGILTCQFPQVQLSGQGSSQGPEFFYNWTTSNGNIVSGELTLTPLVSQPGTYTMSVLNIDNGCENQANTTVTTSQAFPVANAGPPLDLTCAIGQLTLNGTSSSQGVQYGYVWSTPNGNILSGGNTLSPVVDAPGVYDLSVVNLQNGCTTVASVTVGTNYTPPQASVAPGGILSCTVTSLTLDGAGSSTGVQYTYNWTTVGGNFVSGQTTLNPVVNGVGTYTLLITNGINGCTVTASTNVGADASIPTAIAGPTDTLTCAVMQLTLNAAGTSQGGQYSYLWTGPGIVSGGTSLNPLINEPGLYGLSVTNTTNGCTALSSVDIPEDVALPMAEAGPAAQLDCDDLTQTLNGTGSSMGAVFTYLWTSPTGNITSGAQTLNPVVDQPGTYNLLITNVSNGCITTDAVVITQDVALPGADAGLPGLITCTNPTVTIGATGSLGAAFTYTWTTPDGNIASGANTLNPVVDAPGTYNLLITNINNACTATDNVAVAKDANVPVALAQVAGELNCTVQQLQLNGTNSSQGPTITNTWTTTNGNIVSGANTLTPLIDAPGQYVLTIFNTANNCLAISTVSVGLNLTPPLANAGNPAVISCLTPVLTLNGNGSSQGPQYSYNWTTLNGQIVNGGTTTTPQIDQSGFYTIVVTDASNTCTASATVQIILDQNTPEADAGASPTLTCAVTSLNLNGTASSNGPQFTYQWATGNGQILGGATTLTPSIGTPGTYQLTVFNAQNGCFSIAEVLVNQNIIPPVANAGASPTLTCAVTTIALDGTGSSAGPTFKYQWSTANGQIVGGGTTLAPTVGDPGLYTLLVTDLNNGCTQNAAVQVLEDLVPPLSAASVNGELTCSVTSLPLSGNGSSIGANFVYQWSTNNGVIIGDPSTLAPNVGAPGNYNILVTNTLNGCTQTATVPVTQNITPPQPNAGTNGQLSCATTELNLAGTATGGINGVSYVWTGPGIVSGANTPNPLINQTGTYTLTATDLYNGCTAADAVNILPNVTPPTVAIAPPGELTCTVLQLPINAQSSSTGSQYLYLWSTGNGYIVSGPTTLLPTVNQPGTYNLLITNTLNGCTTSASATVSQNVALPVAEAGNGFELTCTVEQGSLSTAGSSAGASFAYAWSTSAGNILSGSNTATPLVNAVGTYNLLVTNTQTGCTLTDEVAVSENTNYPDGVDLITKRPGCGGALGSIVFEAVSGGVGPYLYSIDGGDTYLSIEEFGNLTPGAYNLVVQDVNGCEYEESLVFPVPVEPQVILSPEIVLAYGATGTLTATLNIPLYEVDTIIWSPQEGVTPTSKINVVQVRPFRDTEYTVTIINKDGCTDVAKVLVRVSDPNIWAPNVFSPNDDGQNDVFLIFAGERTVKKINNLQIYDRWGNQIFYAQGILPNTEKHGWDGRFGSQPMNPAVFVWWAEVELESGELILMKGDVTLVR